MGKDRLKHIPHWARTCGDILAAQAELRFYCPACELLYDADLRAIIARKGGRYTLIQRQPACKAVQCRRPGFFVAAVDITSTAVPLLFEDPYRHWRLGWRFSDFEPGPGHPGRTALRAVA